MNIDSHYSVRHCLSPGRERRACCGYLNQGRGLSPLSQGKDNDAQLFVQTRTLRIRQRHGFNFSSEFSTSPLRAVAILPLSDFHEVSRAGRPYKDSSVITRNIPHATTSAQSKISRNDSTARRTG